MSYLLYGQNALQLDERILELRQRLDPENLNTTTIDVQSSELGEIRSATQAMPFFGGVRLVVLVNPISTSRRNNSSDDTVEDEAMGRIKWSDLTDVLKSAPSSTALILRHDGSLAPTHYVHKAAKSLNWTIEAFPVKYGPELLAWVQARSRQSGVDIEPQAATHLLDLLFPTSWQNAGRFATDTPDMRLIATEIDKLSNAAIDGTITRGVVHELVADRSGYTAFKLNDVIFTGRTDDAIVELFNVLESGDPAERVISQLSGEAAALASARAMGNLPKKAVADATGVSEPRLARLADRANALQPSAHRAIAEAIRNADAGVKTGHMAETSATITPLVAELAEVIHSSKRQGRRRP